MTLPPFLGRLAALLLLGGLLWAGGWVLAALLPPAGGTQDAEAELAVRLGAMAQRRPLLDAQARELEAALAAPGVLWSGSPAAASAAMQARVREALAGAGGALRSTAEAPPEAAKGLLRLGLRVEASGTMVALHDSLVRLGGIAPLVLVEGLAVTAGGGEPGVFALRLDLAGYLRAP